MTDLDRIEAKLDEILFRLGKDRPRSSAEINRLADQKFLHLQSVKSGRKRSYERAESVKQ